MEADLLLCLRCGATTKVLAVIDQTADIYRILPTEATVSFGDSHGPHIRGTKPGTAS
jgi:hypothetical protein